MARKTIKITELVEGINNVLKDAGIREEHKRSLCIFLESLLHDTGNYKGFRYILTSPYLENGEENPSHKEHSREYF